MTRFLNYDRFFQQQLRRLVDIVGRAEQCLRLLYRPHCDRPIRIVCVADTHSQTYPIPPGDVLIHAGDLTRTGKLSELQDSIAWLKSQPHDHKIVIAGNADLCLDPLTPGLRPAAIEWGDIKYLCGTTTTLQFASIRRQLSVFGDPHVPRCGSDGEEAFQYEIGTDYWHSNIPPNTDIVVTHGPPRYILDEWNASPEGCASLHRAIERVRPVLHLFGHVHPAYGQEHVVWENQLYEGHALRKAVHEMQGWKQAIKISARLIIASLKTTRLIISSRILRWRNIHEHTTFVNAAAMSEDGTRLKNAPIVVVI